MQEFCKGWGSYSGFLVRQPQAKIDFTLMQRFSNLNVSWNHLGHFYLGKGRVGKEQFISGLYSRTSESEFVGDGAQMPVVSESFLTLDFTVQIEEPLHTHGTPHIGVYCIQQEFNLGTDDTADHFHQSQ